LFCVEIEAQNTNAMMFEAENSSKNQDLLKIGVGLGSADLLHPFPSPRGQMWPYLPLTDALSQNSGLDH
jgi:hypothetical protein